jgi:hypothetical protein
LRWTVPDLIDFDYYAEEDERLAREQPSERKRLSERDRRLYKAEIAPFIGDVDAHTTAHRNRALRAWLEVRRQREDPALAELLPGRAFERGQRLVTYAIGLLGLVLGIGVTSALLSYDGEHPVNVSWYLFWLVLLQILLAGTTLILWYARGSRVLRGAAQDVSLLGHLIRPFFARAARWFQRQRLAHIPPDLRERAKAKQGLVQSHYALYGPAAYLPMLIPAQVFGIGFNVGAILITVALEWFTDLAFGWGSALNVSAGSVHGLVQAIALPWSWLFGEGIGYPTLEQVAGTRISLKDPLFVLDAEHLRSWRWFLVLAVISYGLLPRLGLLGLSALKQRRALAALPFTHQSAQAPYARMITPSLETASASTGSGPEMPIPSPLKPLTKPSAAPRMPDSAAPMHTPQPAAEVDAEPAPDSGKSQPSPEGGTEQPLSRSAVAGKAAMARSKSQRPRPTERDADAKKTSAKPKQARATGNVAETPRPRADKAATAQPAPPVQARAQARDPQRGIEQAQRAEQSPPAMTVDADACLLLLHIDVADVLEEKDHARLQQLLRQQSGWRVAMSATYGGGSAMSDQALGLIGTSAWRAPPPRVALIQDGSQPPITENLRFLRAVRAAAGDQAQVMLALIGDPDDNDHDPLPPLSAFDFTDWQRKIDQMGDPYLRLVMLAGAGEESH